MNQFNDTTISGDLIINKDEINTNVKEFLNELEEKINTIENNFLERTFPVGSYYITHNSTSPAELFGGTWTKIGGRFLYAEGDATLNGQTGGYATVTLNESQMPAHIHTLGQNGDFAYGTGWGNGGALSAYSAGTTAWYPKTSSTGGSQPHDNMPPYIRVAIWRRTA